MADKNIKIQVRNATNTATDTLYPITKTSNIVPDSKDIVEFIGSDIKVTTYDASDVVLKTSVTSFPVNGNIVEVVTYKSGEVYTSTTVFNGDGSISTTTVKS